MNPLEADLVADDIDVSCDPLDRIDEIVFPGRTVRVAHNVCGARPCGGGFGDEPRLRRERLAGLRDGTRERQRGAHGLGSCGHVDPPPGGVAVPIHRLRAASAFVSLLALFGFALVALFAGISRQAYGSVVVAAALVRLVRAARDARVFVGEPGSGWWLTTIAWVASAVAELWGGISLLTRSGGGMYVLAAGLLIHGGVALRGVWIIFVSISEEEAAEIPRRRRAASRWGQYPMAAPL